MYNPFKWPAPSLAPPPSVMCVPGGSKRKLGRLVDKTKLPSRNLALNHLPLSLWPDDDEASRAGPVYASDSLGPQRQRWDWKPGVPVSFGLAPPTLHLGLVYTWELFQGKVGCEFKAEWLFWNISL